MPRCRVTSRMLIVSNTSRKNTFSGSVNACAFEVSDRRSGCAKFSLIAALSRCCARQHSASPCSSGDEVSRVDAKQKRLRSGPVVASRNSSRSQDRTKSPTPQRDWLTSRSPRNAASIGRRSHTLPWAQSMPSPWSDVRMEGAISQMDRLGLASRPIAIMNDNPQRIRLPAANRIRPSGTCRQ